MSIDTSPSTVRPAVSDDTAVTRFPWLPMLVLAAAGFLALTVELSPSGLLTRIAPDLHASVALTGSLTALYSLGNAVLVLPLTSVALRFFSRRTAIALTLLVFVAGNLVVAVSPSLAPALVGRFASGGAHGLLMALLPAVAVRMAGERYRGRATTMVLAANTLGIALGAPLASLVGNLFGWRTTFTAAAVVFLVITVLVVVTVPRISATAGQPMSLLATARIPGVLRICLAWTTVMVAYMAVITYIDPYLEDLGAPPTVTSLSLLIFGLSGFVGVLIAGRLAARTLISAMLATPAAIAVALLLLSVGISAVPMVLVLLGIFGAGFSGAVLVFQQALLTAGHRAPEQATGIGVVLLQGGMALGSTLGGIAVDVFNVGAVPAVGLVFALFTFLLLVGMPRVIRRAEADRAPVSS